jgi:hypothetical protein
MAIVGSFPPKEFIRKNQQQQTNKFNFLRCSQSSRKKSTRLSYIIYWPGKKHNNINTRSGHQHNFQRVDNYRTPTAANTHGAAQLFFFRWKMKQGRKKKQNKHCHANNNNQTPPKL